MSSDDDRFWDDVAGKLRKAKGLCPPTPEEAEAAFDEAPEIPLSDDQIDSIVESVTSGEVTPWDPAPDTGWDDNPAQEIGEQVLAVFRNQGGDDPDGDRAESELERELLDDDDPEEDQTGLGDGATPPGGGG
jgi:hypothetical protein